MEQALPQPRDLAPASWRRFCFFLASALWAFADCAEDSVAEALIESALFGTDCADADVAQAITVTKAKAVVHIFLGNKYSDMAASRNNNDVIPAQR